eukprot:scaffold368_cov258-Pinguiococcus_pyrenoidosus.AAC.72
MRIIEVPEESRASVPSSSICSAFLSRGSTFAFLVSFISLCQHPTGTFSAAPAARTACFLVLDQERGVAGTQRQLDEGASCVADEVGFGGWAAAQIDGWLGHMIRVACTFAKIAVVSPLDPCSLQSQLVTFPILRRTLQVSVLHEKSRRNEGRARIA